MAVLVWDDAGKKLYETGIDKGVLYPIGANGTYPKGVAWNGLTGVDENPSGAEETKIWADNSKYISLFSAEEYGMTVKAYTYPDEFEECDGSKALTTGVFAGQQTRKAFGFAYRTKIGNDVDGEDHGYKLHLVYGCKASPSAKSYNTINDSPEAIEFSWEVTTTPIAVGTGFKPSATIVIDSTKVDSTKLGNLEDKLYGTTQEDPYLPLPAEVLSTLS